ncbi:polynucleotide adenylyltransferase PcnB [Oceanospirillum maris]|uniref:polynucleotide adenylyltransferase PcnB n=1 Tax=Oceanospirillum maris TaxID=64977 RepID=UPI000425D411|nr:polynucleotide adenylyltransferase PcnB [Oceanospirillum maris]
MLKGIPSFLKRPGDSIRQLLKSERPQQSIKPELHIVSRDEHPMSRTGISESALKVLYRLKKANYDAFLVGGCVRDALLDLHPKDFDVATNATPEQVNSLFHNARIIGRRFRIVHVRYGRETIEVTTFRAPPANNTAKSHASQTDQGLLVRDNVYGTIEEDAIRRDFTINALYYNIRDFSIYDYAGGIDDMDHRLIRMIGDPETRYREDPVRMLRAIRFAAKLDFDIESATEAPIRASANLLRQIPAARLFEEVLKLFLSGQGEETFNLLREYHLFGQLFPYSEDALRESPEREAFILQALYNTDKRIAENKPVTPAFLFAALLWPVVQKAFAELIRSGIPPVPAMQQAGQQATAAQVDFTSIPKRFSQPMREIWEFQLRLERRQGKRAYLTAEHPRFRAAYDFLVLRSETGENVGELAQWWTNFQESDNHSRRNLVMNSEQHETPVPRKRRRRNYNSSRKAKE